MSSANTDNRVTVVLGSQWGDEGKGKLVDLLASEGVDVVARCAGGNNAGHTVVVGDAHFAFHLLPSGVVLPNCEALLGNGVVIHMPDLLREIAENEEKGLQKLTPDRFKISDRAHLVFDLHQQVDALQEEKRLAVASVTPAGLSLGTTKKGIGPCYSSKMNRSGLRVADLVYGDFGLRFEERFRRLVADYTDAFDKLTVDVESEVARYREIAEIIRPFVTETVSYLHNKLANSKRVLVEGANAAMLDIDLGTYPYVTSSNCTIGGVCTGLGLPPTKVGSVFGVVKAYTTRVGTGVFPTEQTNEIGERLQTVGHEFGVTTGRKRRCGWLDIPLLRYTHLVNNYTAIALTKLDILDVFDEIKIGVEYHKNGKMLEHFPSSEQDYEGVEVKYITLPGWKVPICDFRKFEDLPEEAQNYVREIERLLGVPVWWIGVGQARDAVIVNKPE